MNQHRTETGQGMQSPRYMKAVVAALLLLCLITLLLYSSPSTNFVQSSVNSLRLELFESSTPPSEAAPALGYTSQNQIKASTPASEATSSPACTPQNHIMFLKTHKCASSTVQNIFLRYGYSRKLIFALANRGNYLGNPHIFKASMIPNSLLPPSGKVDIFAVHTRLNPVEHTKVLHNDTIWVTVVRDPVALYESLYNYFHSQHFYHSTLEKLVNSSLKTLVSLPRYLGKFGMNQMIFDMGYNPNLDVFALRKAIEELDSKFHLIMISELLDESLILLRHLLCWSLDDVVFFTKNARREEFKPQLPISTQLKIREMNSADTLLYDHFLAKHKAAVLEFGKDRMAKEVAELKALRDDYFDSCSIQTFKGHDRDLEFKEYSAQVNAYVSTSNNTDENCVLLSMPELPFIENVRKQQKDLLKEINMLNDIENALS